MDETVSMGGGFGMRKKSTSEIRWQRCQQRALLAAMVVATAAPSVAADNTSGLRIISPLPLSAPAAINRVQDNPFCEPAPAVQPIGNFNIQLASDRQESAIRMKPIGIAVGLRSIGEADAPPTPEIFISPTPESAIQTNPLIGSAHHDRNELGEVVVSDDALVSDDNVAADDVAFDAVVDVFDGEANMASDGELANVDIRPSETYNRETVDEPTDVTLEPAVSEALSFSLSDNDSMLDDLSTDERSTDDESRELDTETLAIEDESIAAEGFAPVVGLADPLVAIDFTSDPTLSLKQLPRPHGGNSAGSKVATSPDGGVVSSMVSAAQRYRPPVAVSSPPLAILRNESTDGITLVRPAVTRVESFQLSSDELSDPSMPRGSSLARGSVQPVSATIDLHMTKTQVRTLTIGGSFRRVAVADQAVCQAITAGTNELKLIGTGRGITNLTVWADTGNGSEPKMRVFRVHVGDAVDTTGEAVGDKTETLNQSIARAFPRCRVNVRQANGQLIVTGNCDSNDSASSILRMVRKTCLIPVVDELSIR